MKKYILSLMALLLTATAFVSCDDDFDDYKVNYPAGFPEKGIWASEYTNNDDSEYTAILNMKNGKPNLTVLMYGKSDDEDAAGSYTVIFTTDDDSEVSYDPETGQLLITGAPYSRWGGKARVFLSYLSDLSTLSMHMEVYDSDYEDWEAYVVSTLKPTDILPLYGFELDGTGAIDNKTGESDEKYYRFVLNSPDRKTVGYRYKAASSLPKDIRKAEVLDFYYSISGNTYTLVGTEGEEMILTVNENYEPVIQFEGKSLVLKFGSHVLSESEFVL